MNRKRIIVMTMGILIAIIVLVSYLISSRYTLRKIISSSMLPTITKGDIVIIDKCSIEEVKIRDIICYVDDENIDIVHRVVEINNTDVGIVLYTQGDNNKQRDEIEVVSNNFIGKVINFS